MAKERAPVRNAPGGAAFDRAMQDLPDAVDAEEEINWIRSHPAMGRAARGVGPVKITAKDINGSSCDPAPSKSAVNMLCHWVNEPDKFYQRLLASHAKKSTRDAPGGDEGEVVEHSLADLKKKIKRAVAAQKKLRREEEAEAKRLAKLREQQKKDQELNNAEKAEPPV